MVVVSIFLLGVLFSKTSAFHPHQRSINIHNGSGEKLKVFWLHPQTGEPVPYSDVYNGSTLSINSFVNHTFMFQEDLKVPTANDPKTTYATVSDKSDQVIYVQEGMHVKHTDPYVNARDEASLLRDSCMRELSSNGEPLEDAIDSLADCYEAKLADILVAKNEEIAFEASVRSRMGDLLENYTCADRELPTTAPSEIRNWEHGDVTRPVHVLHERNASKIHLVKSFAAKEECDAIENAAASILHRGTVADGNGGHKLSDHRKAWQAGVRVPFENGVDDPIVRIFDRIYQYANDATGYNMKHDGQEDIMSIQYFGRGADDESPDQYRPHCDGDCDGLPHKQGGRVATMVIYCTVPEVGGATNFAKAGVHVNPEFGSAAFFSYMDPVTQIKDTGWTTHSGCPVVEGTKRIAVHWMRLGVDADNPWDSFNTLTIKKSELEESS